MKKAIIITVMVLVFITILLTIWCKRYELGLQKLPSDFSIEKNGGYLTYYTDGTKYYSAVGNYVFEAERTEITKKEFISAYKELLANPTVTEVAVAVV